MTSVVENPIEDPKPQKKEVEILKVLAEKVRGHVKWYSVARRYGFISRNDDGGDLFVHRSVISSCSRRIPSLRSGEEVEFNVVETNHGVEAVYVTGPGGQPVKGIRPMYRRNRTTSEPNMDPDSAHTTAFTAEMEHAHPRQGGRRPRVPCQPSNRVHSAGANESQRTEPGEHSETGKLEGTNGTTTELEHELPAIDGQSPNHTVPRQRRRPQRRTPRHRSAPTADTGVNIDSDKNGLEHGPRTPVARYDGRGQPRPFRRPFRQRGGFRYVNGYTYGQNYMVQPAGPSPYQNRFRGYRDAFDQGPRRRGFGGGYPRGPRRRPPLTGDHAPRMNEQPGIAKEEQPVGSAETTDASVVPKDKPSVISAESVPGVVLQPEAVPETAPVPQEHLVEVLASAIGTITNNVPEDTTPVTNEKLVPGTLVQSGVSIDRTNRSQNSMHKEPALDSNHAEVEVAFNGESSAIPTLEELTEAVQQVALDNEKLELTTVADVADKPTEHEIP